MKCSRCNSGGTTERYDVLYCISRLSSVFSVNLQLQRQRSSSDRQFSGPIDCARQVIRSRGILGLWTGSTGSLIVRANFFWMFMSFEVSNQPIIRGIYPDLMTRRVL